MEPSSSSYPLPSSYWDAGKLFVGGISWDTGEAALRDHFSKYGDVSEAVSVKERSTGIPRGFAFVLFADHASADRALEEKEQHVILGRTVDVKRARCRSEYRNQYKGLSRSEPSVNASAGNQARSKKVFVGGLPLDVREDVFRAYFEKFGVVTDAVVIYDSSTQRSRGFGFVEFEKEETVEEVLRMGRHELNNKVVDVKNAVPKDGYYHKNNSNFDGNSYDSRAPVGVGYGQGYGQGYGYGYGYYPGGYFPGYGPRYGGWHGYMPPLVPGYMNAAAGYGGGYAFGGYGRFGYRPPFIGPRGPWNQQEVSAPGQNQVPYGGGAMYPGYTNGGYYGAQTGGYHGAVLGSEKLNQNGSDVQTKSATDIITSQVESLKLDAQ